MELIIDRPSKPEGSPDPVPVAEVLEYPRTVYVEPGTFGEPAVLKIAAKHGGRLRHARRLAEQDAWIAAEQARILAQNENPPRDDKEAKARKEKALAKATSRFFMPGRPDALWIDFPSGQNAAAFVAALPAGVEATTWKTPEGLSCATMGSGRSAILRIFAVLACFAGRLS